MMKKILIFNFTMIFLFLTFDSSFAKRKTEWFLGYFYSPPPISGFDGAIGLEGFDISCGKDLYESDTLIMHLRFDLSFFVYNNESNINYGPDYSITRIPIFLALRLYFNLSDYILPYIEGGPELSLDNNLNPGGIRFGLGIGAGINFKINTGIIGVNFRYHLVKNSYFHVGPIIGLRY